MANLASLRAIVYGRVQGVYFRDFVSKHAVALGLTGHVRNLPDGRAVEVEAEGEMKKLKKLIGYLKIGPPGAGVEKIETNWSEYTGRHTDFKVRH